MPSAFVWIDDSAQQRQRMEDALGAFMVRSTRDELGLSVIRDAFSDLLFPGTGSLQTRAAYFLFVPWMYGALEEQNVPSADIARVARRRELDLIEVLLASQDSDGTIGKRAGQRLKRLPSSVYWTGLGRLRIRRAQSPQDSYHRSLDGWYRRRKAAQRIEGSDVTSPPPFNWHQGLPDPPSDWPRKATLRLRHVDAAYLRECIRAEASNTLLRCLEGRVAREERLSFVWEHSVCAEMGRADDPLSRALNRQVHHARCFSEAMHGAAILYNLIVAEQVPGGDDMVARYGEYMTEWQALVADRMARLLEWDLMDLWRLMSEVGARVQPSTNDFVTDWIRLARSAEFRPATIGAEARRLITVREKRLKGQLARIDNPEVQMRWEGDSGLGRLDFRWSTASALLRDIAAGLEGGARA